MATITLKDIPRFVHAALKLRAKQHGRSLNKEALACLERAVAPTQVDVEDLLIEVRKQRSTLPGSLDDQLIAEATQANRP
jgi:plasmid stability protein